MSLNHVSLGTPDLKKSTAFYDAVLAPLGMKKAMGDDNWTGYGEIADMERIPFSMIAAPSAQHSPGTHVCFEAKTRNVIDVFYDTALKHGGRDNGKPGLRPDYGPNYYAAFVIDPDGHHLEAACFSAD